MGHRIRLGLSVTLAIAVFGALAGTAASAPRSNAKAHRTLTTITVGYSALSQTGVALGYGNRLGFFKKYGINLVLKPSVGSPVTIVPQLLAGQVQGVETTYPLAMSAAAGGLPVVVVAPETRGPTTPNAPDTVQIVTPKTSGITSVAQLAGKTVGLTAFGGSTELALKSALAAAGVDAASVKEVIVPLTGMTQALDGKQVDAAVWFEPGLTVTNQTVPLRQIAAAQYAIMPGYYNNCLMMESTWAHQHAAVVRNFQLAIRDSSGYAATHSAAIRKFFPYFTQLDPAVANHLTLPGWTTVWPIVATIALEQQKLLGFGILKQAVPSLSDFLWPAPPPLKKK